MLYLGYVGFSVPFAFALGALMMRYPGEKWIAITRRWTMVTWLFLTCGIFLGAHWAYSVLGWGGYWGWDPVENASLMPWLTRHRLPPLRHDAGEARHDEELERLAHLLDIFADAPWYAAHARRTCFQRARLCAKLHRQLVHRLYGDRARRLPVHLLQAARPPQNREPSSKRRQPRGQLPLQQHDPAGGLHHRPRRHAVSHPERVCAGHQDHHGRALLQPRQHPHRALPALPHGDWPAARVALDLAPHHPPQLHPSRRGLLRGAAWLAGRRHPPMARC